MFNKPYKYKLLWSLLKSTLSLNLCISQAHSCEECFRAGVFLTFPPNGSWFESPCSQGEPWTPSSLSSLYFASCLIRHFWIPLCNAQHLFTLPIAGFLPLMGRGMMIYFALFTQVFAIVPTWLKVAVTIFLEVQDTAGRKRKLKASKQSLLFSTPLKGLASLGKTVRSQWLGCPPSSANEPSSPP